MTGDVPVVGMKPDTCILADIGTDVPHGRLVVIPADKALRSRDLYRAINQGFLFRLNPGPPPPPMAMNPMLLEVQALREQVAKLEELNRVLQEKLLVAEAHIPNQDKLDTILALLQSAPVAMGRAATDTIPSPAPEVVDFVPPPFIPSRIRSDSMQGRIQTETATGSGDVASATAKLRDLRRGGQH